MERLLEVELGGGLGVAPGARPAGRGRLVGAAVEPISQDVVEVAPPAGSRRGREPGAGIRRRAGRAGPPPSPKNIRKKSENRRRRPRRGPELLADVAARPARRAHRRRPPNPANGPPGPERIAGPPRPGG